MSFNNKVIVVGLTGGIAVYKSAELVSSLKKKGADVHCIMTASAQKFITPLTLRTLSQNPVYFEMFNEPRLWNVEHIGLAEKADLVMVVPATANCLGKICSGIADDFLTTTVMATKAPVMFAPSMNVNMFNNPITQENINKLVRLGYTIVQPGYGQLACGAYGQGRLAELDDIIFAAEKQLKKEKLLEGKNVLVTAGPTVEPLDPVRYLTNHSSGKMGYAIAKQAYLLGANVTLVSGPTSLSCPSVIKRINVGTAREMQKAVFDCFNENDIIIKAAAVADYRPKNSSEQKIKKKSGGLNIELERNPDILASLGEMKGSRILVGFAAETNSVLEYAKEKVVKKNLDFIVANDLTQEGAGFGSDTNIVTLIFADGKERKLSCLSKDEVAYEVLCCAGELCR